MALPINKTPIYNLTIPSTEKVVKYRPFLVKDEKALLIAQQSEDTAVMIDTLKDIIASCIIDEINVNELASFDIEYIFSQIRAKSIGEIVELVFPCAHCDDEKAKVKVSFDLTKLKVEKPENHSNMIELFDNVGIKLRYPDMDTIKKIEASNASDMDQVFNVVMNCIDFIYDSEEVYHAKEQSKQELLQFLENLTTEQFAKIQKFFESMPKIRQEVQFDCPICGKHNEFTLEGINSFF